MSDQIERTLVLLKPDAVERDLTEEIIGIYRAAGLTIARQRQVPPCPELIDAHYAEHLGQPYYAGLRESMLSGPVVALEVAGVDAIARVRALNGATTPSKADPDTIRGRFGQELPRNTVHGSDSVDSAERELGIWFGEEA